MYKKDMDKSTVEYYNTLPPLIKEQIDKSPVKFTSKQNMQSFYKNILQSGPETVKLQDTGNVSDFF